MSGDEVEQKTLIKFYLFVISTDNPYWFNSTDYVDVENQPKWWSSYAECPLLNFDTEINKIRLITEIIQLSGAFLYIVAALRESKFLGYNMFIENLVREMKHYKEIKCGVRKFNKNPIIYLFVDDCTVACNVFILVLSHDDATTITNILLNRIR